MMYKRGIYNKRGIEPKNIESKFDIDEIFFSTTDLKGKILSGNDVFVRVSKFKKDEIIGSPHNIIRHPDMPRAVFKALWDTIKSKKPFIGYVKNMAKDGSYYWVLAAIYPLLDDEGNTTKYLSIRIKPSSEIFKRVVNLYQDVLEYEYKEGMDKALEYLIQKIKELGFENYEEFSKKAFLEEMVSREEYLKENSFACFAFENISNKKNQDFIELLGSLQTQFMRLGKYFTEIFNKVEIFLDINKDLGEKSKEVLKLAGAIRLLSLNASIESYKIKIEGASFSTLSQEMRKNAEKAEEEINNLTNIINDTNKTINDISFHSVSSKLQIDTITYFLQEMINKISTSDISKDEKEDILGNIKDIFHLLKSFSSNLSQDLYVVKKRLISIFYNIKELNNLIERLNFIHINGLIESAHTKNEGGNFTIIFSQMLKLVETAKKQTENLKSNISTTTEDNKDADIFSNIIQQRIEILQKRYPELLQ